MIGSRAIAWSVVAVVAFSTFSCGAVYPWAYSVVAVAAGAIGLAGFTSRRTDCPVPGSLIAALLALAGACVLQALPMPRPVVVALSPAGPTLFGLLDLDYARSGTSIHSLSIAPLQTLLAVALFCACAALMVGISVSLRRGTLPTVARGLIVVGGILALIGLAQRPLFGARLYGIWEPIEGGHPFGPFVNRNHFAGWMLMTLPVALGYLIATAGRLQRPGITWRRRILAAESREGTEIALVGVAIALMSTALVATLSRSALTALILAIGVGSRFVVRRGQAFVRPAALVVISAVVLPTMMWVGIDAIGSRLAARDVADLNGRIAVWRDALRIVRAFPLTGTGINTYQSVSRFFQTADLEHSYSAAHNDYLQLVSDGGLLVAGPAAIAVIVLVLTVRARFRAIPEGSDYWIRSGAVTGLAAIAFQELGDFSLQIPANAVLFATLAGLALRSSAYCAGEQQAGALSVD